jgi:hypothetical protein
LVPFSQGTFELTLAFLKSFIFHKYDKKIYHRCSETSRNEPPVEAQGAFLKTTG